MNKQPIRHGDVLLTPTDAQPENAALLHNVLAEGEMTGHAHRITAGDATLYSADDGLLLVVKSSTAQLTHEEHKAVEVPRGTWNVKIQRQYQPEGWTYVQD